MRGGSEGGFYFNTDDFDKTVSIKTGLIILFFCLILASRLGVISS